KRLLVLLVCRIERDGHIAPAPAPPTPTVARLIDGDAIEPSAQVCVAAKVRDGAEGLQESLLRQVARFFRVFRQAIEQRVDVGRTLAHEKIERGGGAGPQSVKELGC